jgi:uncharacterized protein YjbJ (UPF0337 family)
MENEIIMGKINDVGQKVKGNIEQVKGKIEDATGQHLKGKIDEIRGKVNVLEADLKMKVDNSKI